MKIRPLIPMSNSTSKSFANKMRRSPAKNITEQNSRLLLFPSLNSKFGTDHQKINLRRKVRHNPVSSSQSSIYLSTKRRLSSTFQRKKKWTTSKCLKNHNRLVSLSLGVILIELSRKIRWFRHDKRTKMRLTLRSMQKSKTWTYLCSKANVWEWVRDSRGIWRESTTNS
jgi:hypothetical protein